MSETPRLCREVRELLATDAGIEPTAMQRRVAQAHLKSCDECAAELAKQSTVSSGLSALRSAGSSEDAPPDGLLAEVLAGTEEAAGVRTRLAAPARGALSGARPELTAAVIVGGALAGTGIAWGTVQGVRRLKKRRRTPIS